jgi:hypothetical protein
MTIAWPFWVEWRVLWEIPRRSNHIEETFVYNDPNFFVHPDRL